MSRIANTLRHIKGNLTQVLPPSLPDKICRALGQSYRHRTLTPAATTYLFLQQILHGNPACNELRHLSKIDFTDSAYCQARGDFDNQTLLNLDGTTPVDISIDPFFFKVSG